MGKKKKKKNSSKTLIETSHTTPASLTTTAAHAQYIQSFPLNTWKCTSTLLYYHTLMEIHLNHDQQNILNIQRGQ